MPLSDKAHVFNVDRAAINASSLSPSGKSNLVGTLHNAETIVNIVRSQWEYMVYDTTIDHTYMTIKDFNDLTGTTIKDPFTSTSEIKSVQHGSITN